MKCNSILDAIGNTPLIRLNRIARDLSAEVWVKADYLNPGGSVKDRIAVSMIDEAELQRGSLKPGGTIVEGTTSGNTGMALALVSLPCADTKLFSPLRTSSRAKKSTC